MMDEKRKFRRRKLILTLFHIILVAMSVFGISAIHLNSNYGKGIKWVYENVYEDSAQFGEQLIESIDHMFTCMGYKDMFETNKELDTHRVIVRVSNGPEEQGTEWTLDRIVHYVKTRGYHLDENFQLAGSLISMDDEEEKITVDFRSYNPDFVGTDAGETPRMTMEDLTPGTLVHLSEYCTIYYNYIENDTDLSFRVEYKSNKDDIKISTNVPDKTTEEIVDTEKYLYVPGNTIHIDTNMTTIPTNATTLLEIQNPYKNDKNCMVLSADTSYPNTNAYSVEAKAYKEVRSEFIMGMGSVILGSLGCMVALAMLMLMSGHATDGSAEIHLFPIDGIHTELCPILRTAAIAVFIHIGRHVGVRLFSLFAPNGQWNYWNRMIKLVVVYGSAILCGFDLLRRYKARTLWSNSLTERTLEASKDYVGGVSYAVGAGFCYLLFLGLDAGMLWGLIFPFFYKGNKLSYQIVFYVFMVLYLGLGGWICHLLFKKSVQRDVLDMAVNSIPQGDTSYQIDATRLSGKGRQMAEYLNNISSGLDSATQEQTKSGRLKASPIANVSHDIRTSLTSIINCVDLLKRERIQDPKITTYLGVLDQKSRGLKTLTEDLVETSRASSGSIKLDMSDIDLVELIQQTNGEFEERFALRRLELISNIPNEVFIIRADGRHLWRVLENLYTNAVGYTMEHSRVCVDVLDEGGRAMFTIKSVSESSLNISPDELTERLVRGDASRATGGNGLGLFIPKDLTQLQGGEFQVVMDRDLSRAVVPFPVKRVELKAGKTVRKPRDISQDFGYEEDIVV